MPEQNVPTTTEQAHASSESAAKPSLGRVIAAWAVHAFTISGLAWATLALFAMLDNIRCRHDRRRRRHHRGIDAVVPGPRLSA